MGVALSLDEAKQHLNISTDEHDDELASTVYAAEAAVAVRVGPLTDETRTARVRGGGATLILPSAPAISLTSVATSDGTAVDVADLTLITDTGVVEYTAGGWFYAAAYDITYEAGWTYLPDDLLFAVKELVRHMWSTQRGAAARPGSSVQEPSPGYLLPNRVLELLEPYRSPRVA